MTTKMRGKKEDRYFKSEYLTKVIKPQITYITTYDLKIIEERRLYFEIFLAVGLTFLGYSLNGQETWSWIIAILFLILSFVYLYLFISSKKKISE